MELRSRQMQSQNSLIGLEQTNPLRHHTRGDRTTSCHAHVGPRSELNATAQACEVPLASGDHIQADIGSSIIRLARAVEKARDGGEQREHVRRKRL